MSERWNVVVPDRLAPPADVEQAVFGERAVVTALNVKTEDALRGKIEDADAILAWHDLRWTAPVLATLRRCKVIVRVGVGFDNVDLAAARSRGIAVCNVPDYGTHDVADHAIALLLALARGLVGYQHNARNGAWAWGTAPSFRVTDKMLGIVGLGRIGTATAQRAKALAMRVGFYDPYKPAGWDKALGLERFDTLADLAAAADVVSLHVPLTAETRGMIGREFFAAAKPGVVLVNTARGPVVDWAAFSAAFRERHVRSAGFDVLPDEPPDTSDPLVAAWIAGDQDARDRLVITPHCAFYSSEALVEMRDKAAREALRVLSGVRPLNLVN
ncbi:MAG: C-terminal binding protein [Deltaproteobacteria bacterium]|nr:C-terminal binding protein [Deltaproteobacteria bacterium]